MMPAPKPPGPGRPAHQPTAQTRRTAESMSAFGIPQDEIAKVLGIAKTTLHAHYRDELDTAHVKAIAAVAQCLYKQATDPENPRSAASAMFWLKTQARWRETTVVEQTGLDGGPIQVEEVSARERINSRIAGIAARSTADGDTGEPE